MTATNSPHIPYLQYINELAEQVDVLPEWTLKPEQLLHYYRTMVLCRVGDQKAVSLQRTGQLGTYPSALGQEAIATVFGSLMRKDDVLIPYYRDHAAKYLRGVSWKDIYLYWGGDERGSANPKAQQDLPDCVPIATQCTHAVGVASAFKIRNEKRVAVCSIGDGGTSKGDFLESLNMAGAWHLPVVFIINNNQWAISVPRTIQCGAPTLAQKGIAAGVPSFQVDGNDVVALHETISSALDQARAGKGPTLIEAISYRLGDHTTADDASRYRSADELAGAWDREPIKRLQTWLHRQGWWNAEEEKRLQEQAKQAIQKSVQAYLDTPPAPLADAFDYQYAELPDELKRQRQAALASVSSREKKDD